MKIIKYKKMTNSRYKVFLDDSTEMVLFEDVILKYNLLIEKCIDNKKRLEIDKYNEFYQTYYDGLNSIKRRIKSKEDLKKYLIDKKYDIDSIIRTLEKLEEQGYINDNLFAKSYINNAISTTSKGPHRVYKELLTHNISDSIILKYLNLFIEEDMINKINKIISKMIKSNNNKSGFLLKSKINSYLINLGYDNKLISKCFSNFNFSNNSDIRKKIEEKLRKSLSRKYKGDELEMRIRNKMYQKGFY